MNNSPHIAIMPNVVVNNLVYDPNGIYIDSTIGFGGHSSEIIKNLNQNGQIIGIDKDPYALKYTEKLLSVHRKKYKLYHANYSLFPDFLNELGLSEVNGFLFDLGTSSYQIDSKHRGFSFQKDSNLDMRFNPEEKYTAKDFLHSTDKKELSTIIKNYSDEMNSYKIACSIMNDVSNNKMNTTVDLKNSISKVVKGKFLVKSLSRVFQAIRIHVNDELNSLTNTLESCIKYLSIGGRIVVISFHSIEDRIVKRFFKHESINCVCPKKVPVCTCDKTASLKIITKKPILPSEIEVKKNPRSRSAKLRVAERI